ncbi:hypothetical protein [Amphibacillus cookii]|uniref:hypothetical protein n=1 Tax=Amphibacillus cookii TaxID=767787 RepID=UPI00195A319B|nr:hypothetical protein [Amphibacillus cookii]MBM7540447.1 hypothetical protein [Amphibacillus cookii]
MKRKVLIGLIGIGTTFVTYQLLNDKRQERIKNKFVNFKNTLMLKRDNHFPIEEAGGPLSDNMENADMVSEGSLFGVNYFNQVKQ